MQLELRALMPEDEAAARGVIAAHYSGSRHHGRLLEQLGDVLRFEDPEYLALVAQVNGSAVGLVMFGTVAGALGVVKLHAVMGRDARALDALVAEVVGVCERSNERLIIAELPDDARFADAVASLRARGFAEEGRVPDYVCDGVAMQLLVRRSDTLSS